MTNHDLGSLLAQIAGVCGVVSTLIISTVTTTQAALHPGVAPVVPAGYLIASAIIGGVGLLASQLIRIFANPSPPAGQVSVTAPKETTTP